MKNGAVVKRIAFTGVALFIWFWTQSLISSRPARTDGVGDMLQLWSAPLNAYFYDHPHSANLLLIFSSGLIDAIGIFLLGSWIFFGKLRPLLGLVIVTALRQLIQGLCALPTPVHMIWHYPGFPSLLVTYNVANDFYFSGHTGVAVLGAIELSKFRRPWLTASAVIVAIFEIATVLVLRAHYTMDVVTGIFAAFFASSMASALARDRDGSAFSA